MKNILSFALTLFISSSIIAQNSKLISPSKIEREQIIHHKGFSISYNSAYVMPHWISYMVIDSVVNTEELFKGKYIPDAQITTRAAEKKDYKDGGYLMAQLVNYFDISSIEGAKEESFYMSNITPMKPAFHKHIWLKTEGLIRTWAKETDSLYVVCAPVYKEENRFATMGKNKVSVPKRFYKIVYDAKNNQAVAFLFKNGMSSGTLKSYSVPVSTIEQIVEIDFFPHLNPDLSEKLKKNVDYDFWNFDVK